MTLKEGELVTYRRDGDWRNLPTAGEVVGVNRKARTIDVMVGGGTVVEVTPEIFDEFGAKLGLNRNHVGCRFIFAPSAREPIQAIIYRIPESWTG